MDVSILIVTYNSEKQIEECLNSVYTQRGSITQEVIVVDNDSKDGTVALIRARFPEVKLITAGRNLGFAAGVNLAARHAEADYVLLLNPDTVVLRNAIDKIVEFARANPAYGLYGGRTLKPDGSLEPSSCWGLPTLWSLTMFASGLNMIARRNRFFDPESLGSWPRNTVREVGIITGCFLLVERNAWTKLKGMDERYFLYGEDADFSKRAALAGYRPVIVPHAEIMHEIGQSSATPAHKMLMLLRGKACFFITHYKGLKRRLALFLLLTRVATRAALSRVKQKPGRNGKAPNNWQAAWQNRHNWIGGFPKENEPRASVTSLPAQ